jgi:spore maturation protein CgeB
LLFKAGLSGIIRKINRLFIEKVKEVKPAVVWVFKGMELRPSSLEQVKKMGIKLVNYNPDNPFIFTGKGSGNNYVTAAIGLYDLHFTYNLSIEQILQKEYGANTAFLPFGFEISDTLYQTCAKQEELVKACFLGNPDKQRAAFIMALAAQGITLDVYGNHWNRFVKHPNINMLQPVYGDELWQVLRRYRVQLNLMRIHNENSHNMRSFEVPGIGGIMIAPRTTEHEMFFEDGKEIFLFDDISSCAAKIRQVLSLPADEANVIRQHARMASLQRGYRYSDRAQFALEGIKSL